MSIVERFKTLMPVKMHLAAGGVQVDGVVIDLDEATGKATSIERIQRAR